MRFGFQVMKFSFNLLHVLLVCVFEIMFRLLENLAKTFFVVLKNITNFTVGFLDNTNVLFYTLKKSEVFVSTKFVNGRRDFFHEVFKV